MTFKTVISKNIARFALFAGIVLSMSAPLTSCDAVYDDKDLEECEMGVSLRFVYEYNMLRANAFAPEVDCITVFIFDENNRFVRSITEHSDILKDPDYTMPVELNPGVYNFVVYGGLSCDNPAFNFAPDWINSHGSGTIDDILVTLPRSASGVSNKKLHDLDARTGGLFYGTLQVKIDELNDFNGVNRHVETVYLMKDNNNIHVTLYELSNPADMDVNHYSFKILDDNFALDGNNNKVSQITDSYQTSYEPYLTDTRLLGYVSGRADEQMPAYMGIAELSTSRLFDAHSQSARLIVTTNREHNDDGSDKKIIDIPFISYLTTTRTDAANWIKGDPEKGITANQEFLDRESNWHMTFVLQKDRWVYVDITVENWTVRVNNAELSN